MVKKEEVEAINFRGDAKYESGKKWGSYVTFSAFLVPR
jgi:hypothetical protein